MSSVRGTLGLALERLGSFIQPDLLLDRLVDYVSSVERYNQTHRIVGALTTEAIAEDLVVDALGLWPFITSPLADVGSGAGLPGIVLKLLDAQLRVTLIEPRQKPAAFLSLTCGRLGLSGVRVADARAEELTSSDLIDQQFAVCLVAKGFGPLSRLLRAARHLAAPGGLLLVPSSEPNCETPGARVDPHPLLHGRFIHSRRLEPGATEARIATLQG